MFGCEKLAQATKKLDDTSAAFNAFAARGDLQAARAVERVTRGQPHMANARAALVTYMHRKGWSVDTPKAPPPLRTVWDRLGEDLPDLGSDGMALMGLLDNDVGEEMVRLIEEQDADS